MKFLTGKRVSRRHILRGVGAGLALPMLDAMLPAARAIAQEAVAPKRFGAVFVPHGERPGFWNPATVGAGFEPSVILQPLAPHLDELTVVSQLANPVAGHGVTVASWLSGTVPKRTVAEDVRAGKTIDQVIADKIGRDTVFKSIEVGDRGLHRVHRRVRSRVCVRLLQHARVELGDRAAADGDQSAESVRADVRPAGHGGAEARADAHGPQHPRLRPGRLGAAQRDVGAQDRSRLGDYLEHVRETEEQIARAERQAGGDTHIPDAPVGIPDSFAKHVELQFELIALAYEADLTRVFTFMMSRDVTQRVYPEIGITEPHHAMSHHQGNEEIQKQLVKLNTYHITLFEKFIARLGTTPDGDGTLLDNSMVLWGSGMSESNNHERTDLPTLLVGGFGGRGSLHVAAGPETPIANFMLSLGQHFGVEMDSFGISTGTVAI